MTTLNSYADVQQLLTSFVTAAGVPIGGAPHGSFWETLTYDQFTTGNIPGVTGPVNGGWPILVVGDAASSNIIQILSGTGQAAGLYGQMPRPTPPYNNVTPSQSDVITALTDWINSNCPNG